MSAESEIRTPTAAPKDKTTIGLTPKARSVAERLQRNEGLGDLMDVALLGFAVAVNVRVGLGNAREAGTTWNVGTFDSSGQVRDLVSALYDDLSAPYRQVEFLVNEGLERLGAEYEGAESSTSLAVTLKRYS